MASKKNTVFNPLTTVLMVVSGVMFVMLTVVSTSYQQSLQTNAAGKPTHEGGSIALVENPDTLTLGSKVNFTTQAPKMKGSEYPMVYLVCYQEGQVVYGQLDHPDTTFILGGGWSKWRETLGPATCKGILYAYGGQEKGISSIYFLAETPEFSVK